MLQESTTCCLAEEEEALAWEALEEVGEQVQHQIWWQQRQQL
jgi:hypothetical protein